MTESTIATIAPATGSAACRPSRHHRAWILCALLRAGIALVAPHPEAAWHRASSAIVVEQAPAGTTIVIRDRIPDDRAAEICRFAGRICVDCASRDAGGQQSVPPALHLT